MKGDNEWDFGYFGKGIEGYIHYTECFNRSFKNDESIGLQDGDDIEPIDEDNDDDLSVCTQDDDLLGEFNECSKRLTEVNGKITDYVMHGGDKDSLITEIDEVIAMYRKYGEKLSSADKSNKDIEKIIKSIASLKKTL